jgi:hypothetical protein
MAPPKKESIVVLSVEKNDDEPQSLESAMPQIPPTCSEGPLLGHASSICQWHEARLRDLEIAYKGVSNELIPVVARLETKMDSVVEKVGDLAETVKEFRCDLSKTQELFAKEALENVGRDLAIKTISDESVKRKQQRNQIYWGFGKMVLTILATVVATALLIFLKLK